MAEVKGFEKKETDDTLPFSVPKQQALMGYLLTNPKFFTQAKHQIKPEWFSDGRLNQVWTITLKYAARHNTAPKATEIKDCPEISTLDNRETIKFQNVIEMCLQQRMNYGLEGLQAELTDWLHARIYMAAVSKSTVFFNSATKTRDVAKFSEAYEVLKRMNREIDDASFEAGQAESFDDPDADFKTIEVAAEGALTFGLSAFDRLLLPEGKGKGSLIKGDTTILLAPTNVGKTTTMITVAAANIAQGKDVLFLTHEGRPVDIKMKIWCALSGLNKIQFLDALKMPEGRNFIRDVQSRVKRHLYYVPLNKAGLVVEEVETLIRRAQDRWIATNGAGKGFDLLIDDYAAKLSTTQAKGGQFARRQIDEVVYNYFVQLALEYEFHCLTAIQTNREGSKVNQGHSKYGKKMDSRLLTMEDVLESWGPMTSATNVISINRDQVAKARNRVTFFICKSRSSETDIAITCKSDYGACLSHHESNGCVWYKTGSTLGGRIDSLMDQYKNKEIPFEEVKKAEDAAGGA